MKVHVDMDKCICSGMCITIAPSLFDLDKGGRLVIIKGCELSNTEQKEAQDAAMCCPVEAIELLEHEETAIA
ncbi:ferredoxin [Aminobacter sp. Piv2-1]|uniref:ferredoxin n=1 Tax=Aminobacter sp. Piv2-1 TaxID=3031122 RepID=UPI0030B2113A